MHFVGINSKVYCDKLKNTRLQIFQAGHLVSKKQVAVVFNKTTIMSLI